MIRIIIVDDHPVVRQGLMRVLSECRDILVVDEADNAQEAISKITLNQYDIVLLDISLPDRDGLDVLKEIKRIKPRLPVLVLSVYSEEHYGHRAIRSGASGYLTKRSAPDELVQAVHKLSQGGRYISENLVDKMLYDIHHDSKPAYQALSNREYQVMLMIASGKTVSEIATELRLSVKTISTHRVHILSKLGLNNNAEITCYAMRNQLIK